MRKITIYDVAREANVSLATVSRVINHTGVVREETRKRVEAAIEKLEFKPNAIAQGLAMSRTTNIALVVPEASFSYTGSVINGILDVCKIYGYNAILHTTTAGIGSVHETIEKIIKSRVDGVCIFNDDLNENEINQIMKYDIPVVLIGNKAQNDRLCSVFVDIEKTGYELALQYIDSGRKNIAIVFDNRHVSMSNKLIEGVKKAFAERNLEFDNVLKYDREFRTTYEFLSNHFKDHKYDLVLANRDSHAFAILNAAHENNIKIPEEMEIIGMLDSKYATMARPQLSSFNMPGYDFGAVSMRLLTKMLKDEKISQKEIEFSYLFTPRQTTKDID